MGSIKSIIARVTDAATRLFLSIFKKDSADVDPAIKSEISNLKIKYDRDNLTSDSMNQICDAIVRLARPRSSELIKKYRIERRAHKDDLPTYIELYNSYAREAKNINEECQKNILKALKVSESVWENTMDQSNMEMSILRISFPHNLRTNIAPTKTLTDEKLIKVLKAQVGLLYVAGDHVDQIRPYIKRPQDIVPIMKDRVNDTIYEEHGVEEEDVDLRTSGEDINQEVQQIMFDVGAVNKRLMDVQQLCIEIHNEKFEDH